MKIFFFLISVGAFHFNTQAQGFIGTNVAALQNKARPGGVKLSEWGSDGVNYYVETIDSVHAALYYVTSFAKTGICTGYEYLAPGTEETALTNWLNLFYIRKNTTTWRSHNGVLLTLAVEGDKVRLTEEKPAPTPKK